MGKIFDHYTITHTCLFFKIDESLWEGESSAIVNEYYDKGMPDQHPEPYQSIGCGWGTLRQRMRDQAFALSGKLDIVTDECDGLMIAFDHATKAQAETYYSKLRAKFEPVKKYITNWSE